MDSSLWRLSGIVPARLTRPVSAPSDSEVMSYSCWPGPGSQVEHRLGLPPRRLACGGRGKEGPDLPVLLLSSVCVAAEVEAGPASKTHRLGQGPPPHASPLAPMQRLTRPLCHSPPILRRSRHFAGRGAIVLGAIRTLRMCGIVRRLDTSPPLAGWPGPVVGGTGAAAAVFGFCGCGGGGQAESTPVSKTRRLGRGPPPSPLATSRARVLRGGAPPCLLLPCP